MVKKQKQLPVQNACANDTEKKKVAGGNTPATSSHPLLFLVMTCDEKNSPESRCLAMTATRTFHVREYLETCILNKTIQYRHGFGCRSIEKQLETFRRDWDSSMPRKEMNRYLRGCFLDTTFAGEEYIPPEQRYA